MSSEPKEFSLVKSGSRSWYLALDTAREAPQEIALPQEQSPWSEDRYQAAAHSLVVLEGR